jgi:hypothetical protein
VQLVIRSRYPQADWLALAGGVTAGGLLLFLTLLVGFRLRSPRRAAVLMVAVPVIVGGMLGDHQVPGAKFQEPPARSPAVAGG